MIFVLDFAVKHDAIRKKARRKEWALEPVVGVVLLDTMSVAD